MDIAWIGHAAFRLRWREGAIVMDPCPASSGYRLNRPQADIVTISNPDPFHSWADGVDGDPPPRHLDAPGEYEIKRMLLTGVVTPPARNGDTRSPGEARRNVAFIVHIDDVTVAHLGDLQAVPSGDPLEELSRADVVLVPVGGQGHLSAAVAADVVAAIEPQLVIPMLYKAGAAVSGLDGVEPFLKAMGASLPEAAENHINVTRASLPKPVTVHVLSPRGD